MTLVIIPSRMNSTRLPGKPLAWIGSKSLIERCALQAEKAGFKPIVATDSEEIANHLGPIGIKTVMTGECVSGTDRVAAAAEIIDPEGKHEFVINYQGDMPFLDPEDLKRFVETRENCTADILTAWCRNEFVEVHDESFIRGKTNSHVGLYGYKREALRRFASMPQDALEISERLEQNRARDRGKFSWFYLELPSMPIEINTQADLDRARSCLM